MDYTGNNLQQSHALIIPFGVKQATCGSFAMIISTTHDMSCSRGMSLSSDKLPSFTVAAALVSRTARGREEERSRSLVVPGHSEEKPHVLSRKPSCPHSWAVLCSATSTGPGTPGTCPCTAHLRCRGYVLRGPGCLHWAGPGKQKQCCEDGHWELPEAATGTVQHSQILARLPNRTELLSRKPGTSQTEPGSASAPIGAVKATQSQSVAR